MLTLNFVLQRSDVLFFNLHLVCTVVLIVPFNYSLILPLFLTNLEAVLETLKAEHHLPGGYLAQTRDCE